MERSGLDKESLTIAYIKDALHLVNSSYDENIAEWKTDITDGIREYDFPANLIKLRSVSVKDTNDDKYKRIRRLTEEPIVIEDVSP